MWYRYYPSDFFQNFVYYMLPKINRINSAQLKNWGVKIVSSDGNCDVIYHEVTHGIHRNEEPEDWFKHKCSEILFVHYIYFSQVVTLQAAMFLFGLVCSDQ